MTFLFVIVSFTRHCLLFYVIYFRLKKQTFKFPSDSENLAPDDQNFVDSIEAIGNGQLIATKCANHGNIYIWNLENTLKSKAKVVQPVHILKWSSTDNYYMNIGINASE